MINLVGLNFNLFNYSFKVFLPLLLVIELHKYTLRYRDGIPSELG